MHEIFRIEWNLNMTPVQAQVHDLLVRPWRIKNTDLQEYLPQIDFCPHFYFTYGPSWFFGVNREDAMNVSEIHRALEFCGHKFI